jgi:hypothetical protein
LKADAGLAWAGVLGVILGSVVLTGAAASAVAAPRIAVRASAKTAATSPAVDLFNASLLMAGVNDWFLQAGLVAELFEALGE